VTKLTVHLCTKCGVQTIWTPDGPLHENDTTDHLADPGRTLTLEWDPGSPMAHVTGDVGGSDELRLSYGRVGVGVIEAPR
jgi:hypothetical protein